MDEKEILGMIDLQRKHCESQRIGDCVDKDCNDCSARVFYNAGYRKESDTAREILTGLYETKSKILGADYIYANNIKVFAKKYGVNLGE